MTGPNESKKPKKRGRKPKAKSINEKTKVKKPTGKKRGRKPKGGKIIVKTEQKEPEVYSNTQNIILHLKCSSKNLNQNNSICNNNLNYDPTLSKPTAFNIQNNTKTTNLNFQQYQSNNNNNENNNSFNYKIPNKNKQNEKNEKEQKINIKSIWEKLDILKKNLKNNNVSDKRSNCFWCTCKFDNPTIYIPNKYTKDIYEVYGCFCSPECACAYLKKENIDNSTLWERYAMLNNIYGKIYNYTKNIKPAPSPYYTLDKYYGNLTIQEYRKLFKSERLLMIVDKPMTKVLPELYEENNELPSIFSNLLNAPQSNNKKYRLKRKVKIENKKEVFKNNFGF